MNKNYHLRVVLYPFIKKLIMEIKIAVLIILVSFSDVFAIDSYSQVAKVSLDMEDRSLEQVMDEIEKQSEFYFIFNQKQIDVNRIVDIQAEKKLINEILPELFAGTNVNYQVLDRQILLTTDLVNSLNIPSSTSSNSQQFVVSGRITDASTNDPMPGVNVLVKGTTTGMLTDINGDFTLTVPSSSSILVFSFIGYNTQEVEIGGRSVINLSLQATLTGLDEVVVIGYGSAKRADLTGSVASMQATQLKEVTTTRMEQSLIGKIAGVEVRTTTGEPGAPPQIRIRGISSISASAEPLYVVDGFPVVSIQSLNPNDIESLDILKDASATAIYGSRGSNGVIIITTKRGKIGSATITLDAYYGLQKITKVPKMQSALEEAQHYFDGVRNQNMDRNYSVDGDPRTWHYPVPLTIVQILNGEQPTPPGTTLDFQDHIYEVLQTAPMSSIALSASGGNENIKYNVSGEYTNQDGILKNTNFRRYSLRGNIDGKLSQRLNLKLNFNPSYTERLNSGSRSVDGITSRSTTNNPIYNALVIPEYYSLLNPDGTYFGFGSGLDAVVQTRNPLAQVNEINNKQRTLFLLGNINLEYSILEELKFNVMVGTNLIAQKGFTFEPKLPALEDRPAYGTDNSSLLSNWLTEYTLNYNKAYGKHFVTGLAGFTVQKEQSFSNYLESNAYPNNLVPALSATSGILTGGSSNENAWSLISYLARVNYNYAGKYYLTSSIRRDGSSRFGKNNKWGFFPSFALAWRISEESFFDNLNFINEFKLRGSWGNTGNNNIGDYQAIPTVSYLKYALGDGPVGAYAPGRLANDNLTWERQLQTNIGFDLGLFNRLNLSVDYFYTTNKDLLLNVNVAQTTGFTSSLVNIGRVDNTGLEFTLSSTNFKGKFEWNTDFNISTYKNEVKKLGPEGDPIITGGHITMIGQPIGMFYGWIKDGIFMTQAELDAGPIWNPGSSDRSRVGDIRFKDISGPDGVPDGKITNDDKTIMGSPYPDFYYGMTNRFSYKGFTLSVSLQGSYGNQILQISRNQLANNRARFRQLAIMNDYWKSEAEPGDGETPRPNDTPTGNWRGNYSTQWLDDGTYLRINNISLGYLLPSNIANKFGMQSLRLYVNSNNPFTFTKYLLFNPEVSRNSSSLQPGDEQFDFPISKSLIVGMTVTF